MDTKRIRITHLNEAINKVAQTIRSSNNIVITTHLNPDADAIGSACALMLALRSLGKTVRLVDSHSTPDNLSFLPGTAGIEIYRGPHHDETIATADLVFCLDLNILKRVGDMETVIRSCTGAVVMIDHHTQPDSFFVQKLHDVDATSTAELIYKLVTVSFPQTFTAEVAENLYAGIMTDTGNFRFPRVSAETHLIVADLLEHGADPVKIYEKIFNSSTAGQMILLGEALAGMKLYHDGRFCVMTITREMYRRNNCSEEGVEGAVQQTLAIAGVVCGALITEREVDGEVKISLRSKSDFSVNTIAALFGGGGHVNAAGARARNTRLSDVVEAVVSAVGRALNALNQTR